MSQTGDLENAVNQLKRDGKDLTRMMRLHMAAEEEKFASLENWRRIELRSRSRGDHTAPPSVLKKSEPNRLLDDSIRITTQLALLTTKKLLASFGKTTLREPAGSPSP